eukprot:CCRYP_010293-RB/>CCRYP_010293-RB protein AED:0.05 eAED:0.05 QI:191/1/1/1/0.66/0.75/4/300/416
MAEKPTPMAYGEATHNDAPVVSAPEHPDDSLLSDNSNARLAPPPRRTDHTYRDWARHPPDDHEIRPTSKSKNNFPAKLHRILSNPEHSYAISWQPHGRAWKIRDKKLLVEKVIPKYFVQSKYESFTRQLSGWGFKRLHQSGPDFHCYYHESFLRGLPHLTRMMRRSEPNLGKLLPFADGEPNFYDMDKKYPLPPPEGNHHQPQEELYTSGSPPSYPHSRPVPHWEAYHHNRPMAVTTHGFHDNGQPGQLYSDYNVPPPQYGYLPSQQYPYPYYDPHHQQSYPYPPPHIHQSYPHHPPHIHPWSPYPVMESTQASGQGINQQHHPHLEQASPHFRMPYPATGSNESQHEYPWGYNQHPVEHLCQHNQNPDVYPQLHSEHSQQYLDQHDGPRQLSNNYHLFPTESPQAQNDKDVSAKP